MLQKSWRFHRGLFVFSALLSIFASAGWPSTFSGGPHPLLADRLEGTEPVAWSRHPVGAEVVGPVATTRARLACPQQDLEAALGARGLGIHSVSEEEGGGSLSLSVAAFGHRGALVVPGPGIVAAEGRMARLVRWGLVEEVTAGSDGIRQDFVVASRGAGDGPLRLELGVDGAAVVSVGERAVLRMAEGRELSYGRLAVFDAAGARLPARFEAMSAHRLAIVVEDDGARYPVRIDPTVSDADWESLGTLAGTDGPVNALLWAGGSLYVGGEFVAAGDAVAANIVRWNGSGWSALGAGTNGAVHALAVDSVGNLYAGGTFDSAGGQPARHVARWNGTSWSALGAGVNGAVFALAVDSARVVYAGGAFDSAAGLAAGRVARWGGSSWSALGAGFTGSVYALAVDSLHGLVAARVQPRTSFLQPVVSRWSAGAWTDIGLAGGRGTLVTELLADHDGGVYAAGSFGAIATAGGVEVAAGGIAHWDGSAWHALGAGLAPSPGPANAFAMALVFEQDGHLLAGGAFDSAGGVPARHVARWDGSSWSAVGEGVAFDVHALAVSGANDLYAGGDKGVGAGDAAERLAVWYGDVWERLGENPANGPNAIVHALAADGAGNLFAGGWFTWVDSDTAHFLAEWGGKDWHMLPGNPNGEVRAVVVDERGWLYIGGSFDSVGLVPARNIARWDGMRWMPMGTGTDAPVWSLAITPGDSLYVGGEFTTAGGLVVNRMAMWDGTSWSGLGSGMTVTVAGNGCVVWALALDSRNRLHAGGNFDSAGGVPAASIARWDGATWSALGSGMDPWVSAIAVDTQGRVYAGGPFDIAGGVAASRVAMWDGTKWNALGSGVAPTVDAATVRALSLDRQGRLYAGGRFESIGGIQARNVARWDGTAWSALGSGIDGWNAPAVWAFAWDGDTSLQAAGHFSIAGGKVSPFVARLKVEDLPPSGAVGRALRPAARMRLVGRELRLEGAAGPVEILTPQGRRALLAQPSQGAVDLRGLPAGIYLVRTAQVKGRIVLP